MVLDVVCEGAEVRLTVSDNGVGIPAEGAAAAWPTWPSAPSNSADDWS